MFEFQIVEMLFHMATYFLASKRVLGTSGRLHYHLYYALFLLKNDQLYGLLATPRRTSEQSRIVKGRFEPNDVVRVVAFAGTGKTDTLRDFCRYNETKSILVHFCAGIFVQFLLW